MEIIARNAELQNRLIEDVLDVSRIVSGKLRLEVQPTGALGLVESAIESVRLAAEAKEVTIEVHADPVPAPVVGDPSRLQQVFWNLLSNAVKFTPSGGRVDVSLAGIGSQVQVQVRDTGIGIDPAFLPLVFQRFTQHDSSSTRSHHGLGLGLAITRHLVELHGGTVTAESPGPGQGSTFTVCLPVHAVFRQQPSDETASPAGPVGFRDGGAADLRGVRVLVVDDEDEARELVGVVLREAGAETMLASSAAQALELVSLGVPDVVLSDIGMPQMDGYALLDAFRGRGLAVPAIALTAYGRGEDKARALAAGFQLHLSKPVLPNQLVGLVKTLVRHATAR